MILGIDQYEPFLGVPELEYAVGPNFLAAVEAGEAVFVKLEEAEQGEGDDLGDGVEV
jgi:hypothetical protein